MKIISKSLNDLEVSMKKFKLKDKILIGRNKTNLGENSL